MTDAECEQYIVQIIRKTPDAETAAKAIVELGLCAQTNVDAQLALLWGEIALRRKDLHPGARQSIMIRWRPERVLVQAHAFDGTGTTLSEALSQVIDKTRRFYRLRDGTVKVARGWAEWEHARQK